MKKLTYFILGSLFFAGIAYASVNFIPVTQSGTGINYSTGIQSGSILYGQGTSAMATSSGLSYDGSKLTVTNASTTKLSIADDATVSSTSLETTTGNIFLVHSVSAVLASSTLAYYGSYGSAGTTTTLIASPLHSSTLKSAYCQTDVGTVYIVFGNGTASTTAFQCTSSGAGATFSTNNTWTGRQPVWLAIGDEATTPNIITITADVLDKN